MSHVTDGHTLVVSEDAPPSGAWLGPAIGASVLTIAWALYLMPVFFGIVTSTLPH